MSNSVTTNRITVDTPFGKLVAEISGDENSPGIAVLLEKSNEDGSMYEDQIALVESTPLINHGQTLRFLWWDLKSENYVGARYLSRSLDPIKTSIYMKSVGITFQQLEDELEFRDENGIKEPEPGNMTCGWDDEFMFYSTELMS